MNFVVGSLLSVGFAVLYVLAADLHRGAYPQNGAADLAVRTIDRADKRPGTLGLQISDAKAVLKAKAESASGISEIAGPSLPHLLSTVPVSAFDYWPTLTFLYPRAAEEAAGAPSPTSYSELQALGEEEFERWAAAISRLRATPKMTREAIFDPKNLAPDLSAERLARATARESSSVFRWMPRLLGMEWFEINSYLEFGYPEAPAIILATARDLRSSDAFKRTLQKRNFKSRKVGNVQAWYRFGDDEVVSDTAVPADITGHRPTDPFGISRGRASRIFALDGLLAGSSNWASTEAMMDSALGKSPSLANSATINSAIEAIMDSAAFHGVLIQAVFFTHYLGVEDVAFRQLGPYASTEQLDQLVEALRSRDPLPAYELVALADRQSGAEEEVLVALVYPESPLAEAAVEVLSSRLESYVKTRFNGYPEENFKTRTQAHLFSATGSKRSVAVLALRYRTPEGEKSGQLYRMLLDRLYQGDADYLIVAE